jgi:pilus assembly protein CpaB
VNPDQAQKLALAAQVGTLSLALRSADEPLAIADAGPARTIREPDLSLAGAPPSAPRRLHTVARRSRPAGPTIQVFHGSDAQSVSVHSE